MPGSSPWSWPRTPGWSATPSVGSRGSPGTWAGGMPPTSGWNGPSARWRRSGRARARDGLQQQAQLCMLAFDTAGAVAWGTARWTSPDARRPGHRDPCPQQRGHGTRDRRRLPRRDHDARAQPRPRPGRRRARARGPGLHQPRARPTITTRHLVEGGRYLERRHRLLRGARPRLLGALHARVASRDCALELGDVDSAGRLAATLLALPGLPPHVADPCAGTAAQDAHRRGLDGRTWLEEATELARPPTRPNARAGRARLGRAAAWLQGRPRGDRGRDRPGVVGRVASPAEPGTWASCRGGSAVAGVRRDCRCRSRPPSG